MVDVPSVPEARLKEIFCSYLADRGIQSTPIRETATKTPDFWLERGSQRILSELKAPELHFDAELGLYRWKTTHQKLRGQFREAVKQFVAEDPSHQFPRVLTYISCHFQLNLYSMRDAIQGGVQNPDGSWLTTFHKTEDYTRWLESYRQIDGILWLQLNAECDKLFQAGYFLREGGDHIEMATGFFQVLKAQPVGDSDQCVLIKNA
jgi:hypothetical protein